jgi:hypothetical protein
MDPMREPAFGVGATGIAWFAGLAAIVGYSGYRRADERSGSDRRLREELVRRLTDLRARLERQCELEPKCQGTLKCEDSSSRIERLADRVGKADYGFASLLDPAAVGEADLDAISAYDRQILDELDEMNRLISGDPSCSSDSLLHDWEERMDRLEKVVDERRDYIRKVRP